MGFVSLIELNGFIEYRLASVVQRGNRLVETPGAFVIVGGQPIDWGSPLVRLLHHQRNTEGSRLPSHWSSYP